MKILVEVMVFVIGGIGLIITAYYAYMHHERTNIRHLIHFENGPLDGDSKFVHELTDVFTEGRSIYRKTNQKFGKNQNPIYVYEGRLKDDGTLVVETEE